MPAAICKALKPRTIWLTNKLTRLVIQEWIDFRISKRWGTMPHDVAYQSLNPESKFLFNNRGKPYALTEKTRVLVDGTVKAYRASDALEHGIRDIYRKAGLHHASSHSKCIPVNCYNDINHTSNNIAA